VEVASDPTPVYERGFYFESGHELMINGLMLSTKFTLEFYVRGESAGDLLRVLDGTAHFFSFGIFVDEAVQDL
jgi:hypothetical protein